MEDNNQLVILYDYYQNLLTNTNQQIFEDYYFNNYSLGELANVYNISRTAIHKRLKQIQTQLNDYEIALKLVYKGNIIEKIKVLCNDEEIKKLLKELE